MTVRHNVDGNRGKRVLAKRGILVIVYTASSSCERREPSSV